MAELYTNQIVAGRYRIDRLLAKGGMGAVYIAEHTSTEARVALKVLWSHVLSSPDAVAKFEVEAKVAARVNSEHIVRVLDAGYDEQSAAPFLVMELLSGESLEDRVSRLGPLAADEVATVMQQVSVGLDKAHGHVGKDGRPQPIVHRDLKPENLFLTQRESGDPLVKILDFGIAKILSQGTKLSQEVKGTPLFMAYEQGAGQPITPRTDIWAFGLIAFYLLTGKPYWTSASDPDATLVTLMGEVLSLPLVPARQRSQELGVSAPLPAGFDAWFSGCVHRDPAARFASAGAAAAALTEVLQGKEAAANWAARRTGGGEGTPPQRNSIEPLAQGVTAIGTRDGIVVSSRPQGPTRNRGAVLTLTAMGAVLLVAASFFALRTSSRRPINSASAVADLNPPIPSAAVIEAVDGGPGAEPAQSSSGNPAATAPAASGTALATPSKTQRPPTKSSQSKNTKTGVYDDR